MHFKHLTKIGVYNTAFIFKPHKAQVAWPCPWILFNDCFQPFKTQAPKLHPTEGGKKKSPRSGHRMLPFQAIPGNQPNPHGPRKPYKVCHLLSSLLLLSWEEAAGLINLSCEACCICAFWPFLCFWLPGSFPFRAAILPHLVIKVSLKTNKKPSKQTHPNIKNKPWRGSLPHLLQQS